MLLSCSVACGSEAANQRINVANRRPHDDGSGTGIKGRSNLPRIANSPFADHELVQRCQFRYEINGRKPTPERFQGVPGKRGRKHVGSGNASVSSIFRRCAIGHCDATSRVNHID
jgi:hypothetical protein